MIVELHREKINARLALERFTERAEDMKITRNAMNLNLFPQKKQFHFYFFASSVCISLTTTFFVEKRKVDRVRDKPMVFFLK